MIKLLSVLGAVGLTASTLPSVVACGNKQTQNDPVAGQVSEEGILTADFKMRLKKESISFAPLTRIGNSEDTNILIDGLALINSDIDSDLKNNTNISNILKATFSVKYKDIKDNLNNTRDKLAKDTIVKVHLTSNVRHLQSSETSKTIIVNVANTYDEKISGRTLPIVVDLPRLVTSPDIPDVAPQPMPQPEPVNPTPQPVNPPHPYPFPEPVPDKPDHYNPGPDTNPYSNKDVGLVSARMNESGTIISAQLSGSLAYSINKDQIVVMNYTTGERQKVIFVIGNENDREVEIVLDNPIVSGQKVTVAILGIGMKNGLVNCVTVDMSGCKYVPMQWKGWESIWSLTKKTCYYGAAFSWYTFKLSVRVAWLLCPCSWPCEIATTCFDVTWVPKYILDVGMYV